VSSGLINREEGDIIIAVTALSLLISPLWLATARRLMRFAILGITSGHEGVQLLFGRHAPAVFSTWDALAARINDFSHRALSRLSTGLSVKPTATGDAGQEDASDAQWEDVPPEIPPEPHTEPSTEEPEPEPEPEPPGKNKHVQGKSPKSKKKDA
jgi:hypothetical protein